MLGSRFAVLGSRCSVLGRAGGRSGPGRGVGDGWAGAASRAEGRAGGTGTLPSGRSLALGAASLPSVWLEAPLSVNKCLCWIRRDFRREGFVVKVNKGSCGGVPLTASSGGAFTLVDVLFPLRSFAHFPVRTSLLSRCCANLKIN